MEINEGVLKNKLKYLIIPQNLNQSVSIVFLVKVGSRYESKNQSGLAHFVEHMLFKGTKKRPSSKQIGMDIEKIGGSSNAFTSYDYTGYYIKAPKESFEESVEILADMIKNSRFEEGEIAKERGVIIEEIRMYEDRPMSKVRSNWYEKYYGDVPLGRDIAGSITTVSKFKKKNFVEFVDKHYVGSNSLVAVVGNVENEQAREVIEAHFEGLNEGSGSDFEICTIHEAVPAVYNQTKAIEQSHLVLGCEGVERTSEDKYTYEVANAILSQGFGSRLFQVIRDELGLAYYVYSTMQKFNDGGVLLIGLGVENSKVNLAIDAVIQQVKDINKGNFDEGELERAKNYLLGKLVTDLEGTDEVALWYGLQKLLLDEIESIKIVKDKILTLTVEEIRKVMSNRFDGKGILLAGVTPHSTIGYDTEKLYF